MEKMAKCCQEFAAKARQRVVIQLPTDTADGFGDTTRTWATQATVWAVIEPLSGFEAFQQRQLQAEATHKVTIRYRADLWPQGTACKARVLYGDRVFGVVGAINEHERNAFIRLTCKEGPPE